MTGLSKSAGSLLFELSIALLLRFFRDIRKNLRLKYFGSGTSSVTANSSSNSLKSNDKRVSFNVLLTTDFFIMKDASHLRKINWEYLIVDEAHR